MSLQTFSFLSIERVEMSRSAEVDADHDEHQERMQPTRDRMKAEQEAREAEQTASADKMVRKEAPAETAVEEE
jgi:hypothetical protein